MLAWFVTEESATNLPDVTGCDGEYVFVWFSRCRDRAAYDEYVAVLARSAAEPDLMWGPLAQRFTVAPLILKLAPTARSLVRG